VKQSYQQSGDGVILKPWAYN